MSILIQRATGRIAGVQAARQILTGAGLSGGGDLSADRTLVNTGVLSLTGTANQVVASGSTGAITLSLPQSIHTGASPTFAALTLGVTPLAIGSGGTGATSAADARTALGLGTLAVLNAAAAGTLTGATLAAGVLASSLTSVGTLLNLAVTNAITGNISGNAATVTTNANLTGHVTSTGNAAVLGSFSSAQLLAALTDETGTGVAVFGTAPTFTTSITDPLVIGGVGTTSTLSLRSTSGVGTTGADIVFQTGTNGATEAMRILNNGIATFYTGVVLDKTVQNSLSFQESGVLRGQVGIAGSASDIFTGTADNDMAIRAESNLLIGAGGNAISMYIDGATGKRGFGTITPAYSFDIVQPDTASGFHIGGNTSDMGLYIVNVSGSNDSYFGNVAFNASSQWIPKTTHGSFAGFDSAGVSFYSNAGLTTGVSYGPTLRLVVSPTGNVGVATTTFGTSAVGVLGLGLGTAPSTSPADIIQLYTVDLSAGNATLGLRTETAVATGSALVSTHSLSVVLNGTAYKIMLVAV